MKSASSKMVARCMLKKGGPMKFTVKSGSMIREYSGFENFGPHTEVSEDGFVVIAWFDGQADLWHVENAKGYAELRRYYADDWPDWEKRMTFFVLEDVTSAMHVGMGVNVETLE